ncbi:MAG: PQQ-binding-like beta-propeller repeat protein [Nannocystaceae bacterium]
MCPSAVGPTAAAAPEDEGCVGAACEAAPVGDLRRPWRRGGPGSASPRPARGPESAPETLWEVELGAAISASAAFWEAPDGDLVALVGTHAGRFVGVPVDGARAGAIALDVNVLGIIWSSAAVDDAGWAYFGADDDHLHAVDLAAGAHAWSLRLGDCTPARAPGPEGVRCDVDGGPTIGPGGDLFVGADGLYRVEPGAEGGTIRWHYPASTRKAKVVGRHVIAAPLVTLTGEAYYGGHDGAFTALQGDGTLRYQVTIGADVDAAPVMLSNGWVVFGADGGRVIAVDSAGAIRWSFVGGGDVRGALAVADDDTVVATTLDGLVHAIRGGDGSPRWSYAAGDAIGSSPVIDREGSIYVGTRGDQVIAIDARGRRRWQIELPEDVDGLALSDRGVLVVSCDDGVLRALR